jgi:hypothetical protein
MRRLAGLNLPQRLVLVVALAAGLRSVWVYLVCRSADGGWFGYAPLTEDPVSLGGSGMGFGYTLLALAFIAVWAIASLWLLGLRPPGPDRQGGEAT